MAPAPVAVVNLALVDVGPQRGVADGVNGDRRRPHIETSALGPAAAEQVILAINLQDFSVPKEVFLVRRLQSVADITRKHFGCAPGAGGQRPHRWNRLKVVDHALGDGGVAPWHPGQRNTIVAIANGRLTPLMQASELLGMFGFVA